MLTLVAALMCFALSACGGGKLTAIEVVPDTTEFVAGDTVADAVTVNAVYSDGSSRTVTGWTVEPAGALEAGEQTVTFTYTENGVTVTTELAVSVKDAAHVHEFGAEWQSARAASA